MTRLWSLSALALEGYWDSIVQMLANAPLLGAFVALLVVAFHPLLDRRAWIAFALFIHDHRLCPPVRLGKHAERIPLALLFLLLFSLGGLGLIIDEPALTARW